MAPWHRRKHFMAGLISENRIASRGSEQSHLRNLWADQTSSERLSRREIKSDDFPAHDSRLSACIVAHLQLSARPTLAFTCPRSFLSLLRELLRLAFDGCLVQFHTAESVSIGKCPYESLISGDMSPDSLIDALCLLDSIIL
jgi:hypothetical protein